MARAGLEDHIRRLTDQLRGAEDEINELTGHLKDGDDLHAKLKEDARLRAEEMSEVREEAYDKQKLLETQVREFLCDLNYRESIKLLILQPKRQTTCARTISHLLYSFPLPPLLWTFNSPEFHLYFKIPTYTNEGSNLQWSSIPSRGCSNTLSLFML